MPTQEPTRLTRPVMATSIPAGTPLHLEEGSLVLVTQALGGNFTVLTEDGWLAQVSGEDAGALGLEESPPQRPPREGASLQEQVWDALRTVYDPEIPVDVVELGLIYEVRLIPDAPGHHVVEVRMTLTAPGCGMADVLIAEVARKLRALPGVDDARVDLVFDPPWEPDRMSEAARLQTGML